MMFATIALLMIAPASAQATASPPPTVCPADAEPIPATLRAWSAPATEGPGWVEIGRADRWTLEASPTFHNPPERAPAAGSRGIAIPLLVHEGGTYAVALDQRAWIDVVTDNRNPMISTTHGHGPACSGIAKIVRFDLDPGDYVVQISGTPAETIRLLVAKE